MNYTRHFECGYKVVVIGELTNAEIRYCPKHAAAPEMYEALKEVMDGIVDDFDATMPWKRGLSILVVEGESLGQALAKAEGGDNG